VSVRVLSNASLLVLPSHGHCLVHFIDLSEAILAAQYVKSAWSNNALGANNLYVIRLRERKDGLHMLNFSEIFDFQRMFVVYENVSLLLHI
jgi:hypothetical protein